MFSLPLSVPPPAAERKRRATEAQKAADEATAGGHQPGAEEERQQVRAARVGQRGVLATDLTLGTDKTTYTDNGANKEAFNKAMVATAVATPLTGWLAAKLGWRAADQWVFVRSADVEGLAAVADVSRDIHNTHRIVAVYRWRLARRHGSNRCLKRSWCDNNRRSGIVRLRPVRSPG